MRFSLLSLLLLPVFTAASSDDQMILPGTIPTADADYTPLTTSKPTLADLLTIESSASIFYSYARETELSELFSDEKARSTLLVPTNKAVMALARKPHEGPSPVNGGVILPEEEFDALSKQNVERWVSAHIIAQSPIPLSSQTYETLLEGKSVTFTPVNGGDESADEWTRVRLNEDIRLVSTREALNGVIYMIDGTVKVN